MSGAVFLMPSGRSCCLCRFVYFLQIKRLRCTDGEDHTDHMQDVQPNEEVGKDSPQPRLAVGEIGEGDAGETCESCNYSRTATRSGCGAKPGGAQPEQQGENEHLPRVAGSFVLRVQRKITTGVARNYYKAPD
jgi:hypothetical protein